MRYFIRLLPILFFCLIFAASCKNERNPSIIMTAPKANKIPKNLEIHDDVRVDDYYWLNNREDKAVIAYLEAENAYYQENTAHTKEFQEQLFAEMKSRIKEDDESVPYKRNGYYYLTRFETGKEYPIYSRKKESLEAEEEILFNCNELAKGHDFFNLRGVSISPNNKLAAFATDTVSRRQYFIQFKNLETGEIFTDKIENTTGGSVWAADNKTLFYTKKDPVTLRSDKIYKHILGTSSADDVLVFHEEDETYSTFVYKTKSRKYIVIGSTSTLTSEYQFIPANKPDATFKMFAPRTRGLEYSISHYDDSFYVLTNKDNATTKVPVSLVYHKNTKLDGKSPLLQYAYGSYGATIDPYFSSVRLSLLDRGFIYAIAHVRGGEYLGRPWYEAGKLLTKKNTFTDFVDVSKHLITENYTSAEHLYAMGGSAGGLLMGAVVNIAPELYNGVIAAVPFVDVVTTMLDDSIPLTTGEYDEWGNPNTKEYYDYMKSYSPYDNVEAKVYPNLLVTTGLHDSQVQYWEPAKWVAKLRDYKTDSNQLFLDTNMEAGHGGASGRFEALKETAKEYAFILDLEEKIR